MRHFVTKSCLYLSWVTRCQFRIWRWRKTLESRPQSKSFEFASLQSRWSLRSYWDTAGGGVLWDAEGEPVLDNVRSLQHLDMSSSFKWYRLKLTAGCFPDPTHRQRQGDQSVSNILLIQGSVSQNLDFTNPLTLVENGDFSYSAPWFSKVSLPIPAEFWHHSQHALDLLWCQRCSTISSCQILPLVPLQSFMCLPWSSQMDIHWR